MIINNELENTLILINSLDKIYNKSRINGKLNSINLYLLNTIYNILNNCNLQLCDKTKRKLIKIYDNLYYHNEEICKINNIKPYISEPIFVQATNNGINDFPISNKIFYWQDTRNDLNLLDLISEEMLETNYFNNKLFKSKLQFQTGVDITYIDPHRKVFAVSESNITNYIITDLTNNINITNEFEIVLIPLLNMTLLLKEKNNSGEIVKIQIKQNT